MQQLASLWNALDARRRMIVGIAAIGVFGAVLLLAKVTGTPSMALLYSGLEPAVSGEVVGALEQRGVAYSVQGDAIYVDASKRDLMRMSLAEQGLPSSGSAGYELLDDMTGFGTTAQMFDAAYWRAKEGELARTILAWPQVRSARVHIANQVARPFSKAPSPVASVTLKMAGGALAVERARALKFLVASAVAGMSPEDVAVIDSDRGLVLEGEGPHSGAGRAGDYALELKANVERLLSARVGPGNAVVEVSVSVAQEQETIVERRFDPEGRVAISTDTEEITGATADGGAGQVTVASNLPEGDASAGAASNSSSSEIRERVNYEVSETTRELVMRPGKISRISVAVMVNGLITTDANGNSVWTPRSDEELASLGELVQSAVGYDQERGDIVTLKSLEFQPIAESGVLASASPFAGLAANAASLIQTLVLALVILALGLFVIRPALRSRALPPPPGAEAGPGLPAPKAAQGASQPALPAATAIASSDPAREIEADPVQQLRQIIAERQDETIEVLRNWIESSEEHV